MQPHKLQLLSLILIAAAVVAGAADNFHIQDNLHSTCLGLAVQHMHNYHNLVHIHSIHHPTGFGQAEPEHKRKSGSIRTDSSAYIRNSNMKNIKNHIRNGKWPVCLKDCVPTKGVYFAHPAEFHSVFSMLPLHSFWYVIKTK